MRNPSLPGLGCPGLNRASVAGLAVIHSSEHMATNADTAWLHHTARPMQNSPEAAEGNADFHGFSD